jgi:hypothetical protein
MTVSNRWILLLAVAAGAAGGAVIASNSRRRQTTHDRDHKSQLKSWENEGGNLAPIPVAAALP